MRTDRSNKAGSCDIVVFAHVPPPHHGQSYMVKLMLQGMKDRMGDRRFFHVDARISDDLADIGSGSWRKIFLLFGYVRQAVVHRLKHGTTTLYYIPAPPKKSAIVRDILALSILRLFYPRLILHWHAVGLGAWVQGGMGTPEAPAGFSGRLLRPLIRTVLGSADVAISITQANSADAAVFKPHKIVVVPNGIPDPCHDGAQAIAALEERQAAICTALSSPPAGASQTIRVCHLGHCTTAKGFFDSLHGLQKAVARRPDIQWHLAVAGTFMGADEETKARELCRELSDCGVAIERHSFLSEEDKSRFLQQADIMLFPSWTESFGLVAVEALAFGLPVIGSDIPGIRAVLDGTGCALVQPHCPEDIAGALLNPGSYVNPHTLRSRYETQFTVEAFRQRIVDAIA